jgi:UDP-glucose 4-epimerase
MTTPTSSRAMAIAITGAAGYLGRHVLRALAADRRSIEKVVALDVRALPADALGAGVAAEVADVRTTDLAAIFERHAVDCVVHLASIVTPGKGGAKDEAYDVDVVGTRNVLEACIAAGVKHLVVTSSGAAYGFHPDNPEWLREDAPLRGNDEFAYARHKRLVEEMLADARRAHPELAQLVLRPGTILGAGTRNQIADLFEKPVILGIRGAASPFVFAWDEDVAAAIVRGVHERATGIYNVCGDGFMTMRDIATRTGKPYVALPAWLVRGALALLARAGLSQYGPEQVDFLRYRSVLVNDALKTGLGVRPRLSSREVFDLFWRSREANA